VGRAANALDHTVAKRVEGFEVHRYRLVGMTVLLSARAFVPYRAALKKTGTE
jgi:hypothetical protein